MHAAAPVGTAERNTSLDILRGFAVLGILVMNVQLFAMPAAAYLNPTAYGDLTGGNWWVWLVSHVFFDQKFMTIFSLLFGAGIVLFAGRAEAKGESPRGLHYRRMAWLLVFGLLHAYGLWVGDILVTYALCGMIVFPLRRMKPATLLIVGAAVIAVSSAIWLFIGWSMQFWPPDVVAELRATDWLPPQEAIAAELAVYQGGWWTQMQRRVPDAFEFQTFVFLIWGMWRAGGLMLAGMALYKLGVVSGQRSPRFYAAMSATGFAIGVPIILYGVQRNVAMDWDVRYSFFLGSQWNYWGSLFVTAGWIGLVMLVAKSPVFTALTARLAAVGRMAFTNYLLHTLICTTIFYGHGVGLFGRVPRVGQVLVVLGIWAFQLVVSRVWLRDFQFGPVEWLWRSLTYNHRQPFRRVQPSSASFGSVV
jgi:uncharacterized protein